MPCCYCFIPDQMIRKSVAQIFKTRSPRGGLWTFKPRMKTGPGSLLYSRDMTFKIVGSVPGLHFGHREDVGSLLSSTWVIMA